MQTVTQMQMLTTDMMISDYDINPQQYLQVRPNTCKAADDARNASISPLDKYFDHVDSLYDQNTDKNRIWNAV